MGQHISLTTSPFCHRRRTCAYPRSIKWLSSNCAPLICSRAKRHQPGIRRRSANSSGWSGSTRISIAPAHGDTASSVVRKRPRRRSPCARCPLCRDARPLRRERSNRHIARAKRSTARCSEDSMDSDAKSSDGARRGLRAGSRRKNAGHRVRAHSARRCEVQAPLCPHSAHRARSAAGDAPRRSVRSRRTFRRSPVSFARS